MEVFACLINMFGGLIRNNLNMKYSFQYYILYFTTAIVLVSCHSNDHYPKQLLEIDSAYVHGDYLLGDSLFGLCNAVDDLKGKRNGMYYLLLELEKKFVSDNLSVEDFSSTDSLCRYYKNDNDDNYSKALLFRSNIYSLNLDYPSALADCMEAAENAKHPVVKGWANQCQGDLYFNQQMYVDCRNYYRNYFEISKNNHDTLRMAHAAMRMGSVYTIENNIDSTIFFFKKAIELSRNLPQSNNILPYAECRLCDIFIQIGEYEKAVTIMPHDSLNEMNWAYWHLEKNHLDSAKYYFKHLLSTQSIYGKSNALRVLVQLERNANNFTNALEYSLLLTQTEDSIKKLSQVEETKRLGAQYNLNRITRERDQLSVLQHKTLTAFVILCLVCLLIVCIIIFLWNNKKRIKEQELLQEKLLRKAEEEKYKQSLSQIEENKAKIEVLKKELLKARQTNDTNTINKLILDEEALTAANKIIEVEQRRQDFLIKRLHSNPLYIKIKMHAGDSNFKISREDWDCLATCIDEAYNQFTARLLEIVSFSELEMQTCYLIKIGIAPVDIARLLCKSKNAISMLRQRLYKKITHKDGTSKQLDEFILSF